MSMRPEEWTLLLNTLEIERIIGESDPYRTKTA